VISFLFDNQLGKSWQSSKSYNGGSSVFALAGKEDITSKLAMTCPGKFGPG
jgi:hypothetical protein